MRDFVLPLLAHLVVLWQTKILLNSYTLDNEDGISLDRC